MQIGEIDTCLRLTTVIGAIGVAISCVEDLAARHQYGVNGFLSWEILSLETAWKTRQPAARALNLVMSEGFISLSSVAQIIACAILVLGPEIPPIIVSVCLLLIFLGRYLWVLRSIIGLDGAHQMHVLVFAGLFVASLFPSSLFIEQAAIWFIALHCTLAYFAAGMAKIKGESWRKGTAVTDIMAARLYGCHSVHRFLVARPRLGCFLTWSVIAFELSFPLVFAPYIGIPLLILAILFHIANVFTMGLHTFLFAFIAGYPAILFCRQQLFTML
jgi:hypothetical protein